MTNIREILYIHANGAVKPNADWSTGRCIMLFDMPRNARDLFECFGIYDESTGIDSIVSRIDTSKANIREIYHICHARYPEAASRCSMPLVEETLRQLLAGGLLSDEFQSRVIDHFLRAFPEKKRLIFVHVPKCAGTDLTVRLESRFPSLHQRMEDVAWTPKPRLFELLKELVAYSKLSNWLLVSGHIPILEHMRRQILRPSDRIFTIVRDPTEMVLSGVNYIVTLFHEDPEGRRPDVKEWFSQLGIKVFDPRMSDASLQKIARDVLHLPGMIGKDWICQHLGSGTLESSIETIIISDIEILDTATYKAWLDRNWILDEAEKVNVSRKFLQRKDLTPSDMRVVDQLTLEDQKLYNLLKPRIDASQTGSIKGGELVTMALGVPALASRN